MLKMRHSNVLLKQVAKATITKGGIHLAETDTMKAEFKGEVVAIGDAVRELSVGDVAWFGAYSGSPLMVEDVRHLVMHERDVLAREV